MNIFEGSRRISKVVGVLIVTGFVFAYYDDSYSVGKVAVTYQLNEQGAPPKRVDKCTVDISTYEYLSDQYNGKVVVTLCFALSMATLEELPPAMRKANMDGDEDLAKSIAKEIISRKEKLNKDVKQANFFDQFDVLPSKEKLEKEHLDSPKKSAPTPVHTDGFNPDAFLGKYKFVSSFEIPLADEGYINRLRWFEKLKQGGDYLLRLLATLAAFWVFTWGMGWIVRGFSGIPRGQDSKPNTPLESK
jgi:hypothetical protein